MKAGDKLTYNAGNEIFHAVILEYDPEICLTIKDQNSNLYLVCLHGPKSPVTKAKSERDQEREKEEMEKMG